MHIINENASLLNAALQYAEQGYKVLPLVQGGSTPACKHGFKDATDNQLQIKTWWTENPDYNIGIATGAMSGIIAIDVDCKNGKPGPENFEKLRRQYELPITLMAKTPSNGTHHIYAYNGIPIKSTQNQLAPGVDVRGDGGYIVAWPSRRNGKTYQWLNANFEEIQELPPPFIEIIKKPEDTENLAHDTDPGDWDLAEIKDALAHCKFDFDDRDTWAMVGMALRYTGHGEMAYEIWEAWSRQSLKYNAKDQRNKWNSFNRKSGKVITPETIFRNAYDNGWKSKGKIQRDLDFEFFDTDIANCQRFAAQHGDKVRHTFERGWLVWDGKRWHADEKGKVITLAKRTAKSIFDEIKANEKQEDLLFKWAKRSQTMERLKAMVYLAQSEDGIPVSYTEFDADPYLINCLNGTLDLRTGELFKHRQDDHISKLAPVNYEPDLVPETFLDFLAEIMDGDAEMMHFLQRAIGYSLTGDIGEQCLFFCYGGGANGKSVLIETIKNLLGEYTRAIPTTSLMHKKYDGVPNDIAMLSGARFVATSETDESQSFNESLIKDLTGGDTISARFLRHEFFEFHPQFKLWIRGNEKPQIRGTSEGIWRRIHLIPFTVHITKKQQDPKLIQKLKRELDAIFLWAVRGCLSWQQQGLNPPQKVSDATKEYRNEMDVIGRWIEERCILGNDKVAVGSALYRDFRKWADESNERMIGNRTFGEELKRRFACKRKTAGVTYFGIGLLATDTIM